MALTSRLLQRSGWQVQLAWGISEMQTVLQKSTPRLIIMDCELPDGSGIWACQALRKSCVPVKILLTSNDAEDELNALNAGADDFMKKPFRVEVLLARMKRLLALC